LRGCKEIETVVEEDISSSLLWRLRMGIWRVVDVYRLYQIGVVYFCAIWYGSMIAISILLVTGDRKPRHKLENLKMSEVQKLLTLHFVASSDILFDP
jgi:hypothetical protein